MKSTKIINRRSSNLRKNLSGSRKLYKYALKSKKRKWSFLLRTLEKDYFQSFALSETNALSFKNENLSKSFALEWNEKQAFKAHYNIPRENSWAYLENLSKKKTSQGAFQKTQNLGYSQEKMNLLSLWDSRLDICLWKAFFFSSVLEARQAILHGTVKVNSKKITKIGRLLKKGDHVTLCLEKKAFSKKKALILKTSFFQEFGQNISSSEETLSIPPKHLEINYSTLQFVFISKPSAEELLWPYPINIARL